MKPLGILVCLALVFHAVECKSKNSPGVHKEENDNMIPEASKISELYISDLLRTNDKSKLDTASTNQYHLKAEPDADLVNLHRATSNQNTREEILPPLAVKGQMGPVQYIQRASINPENPFQEFLAQQGHLLERNVYSAEQSVPATQKLAYRNYPDHQPRDCDKHSTQSTGSRQYSRYPQEGSRRPEYDSHMRQQHYSGNQGESSEHYSSHTDPVYTNSKSEASKHNSDSNSKTHSSSSQSKSFSKTLTPKRTRQKAYVALNPSHNRPNYATPYEEDNRGGNDGSYHEHSNQGPSSYEGDSSAQYERPPPHAQRERPYEDFSPPAHVKKTRSHSRPPPPNRQRQHYHSSPPPSTPYKQVYNSNERNHPQPQQYQQHYSHSKSSPQPQQYQQSQPHSDSPQYQQQYPQTQSYSRPQQYQQQYTQSPSHSDYESHGNTRHHSQQGYSHNPSYDSPPHKSEKQSQYQNTYPPQETHHSSQSPQNGRKRTVSKPNTGEERKQFYYRSDTSKEQGSGEISSPAAHWYPMQSRSHAPQPHLEKSHPNSSPLHQYATEVIPSKDLKPDVSISLSVSERGGKKILKKKVFQSRPVINTGRSSPAEETPSVEESRIDAVQSREAPSSTSKSVSFSESRSFNLEDALPFGPKLRNQQTAKMNSEPKKINNSPEPRPVEVQSRHAGYSAAYKPYNSEYPASYMTEQHHNPLHGTEPTGRNQYYYRENPSQNSQRDNEGGHQVKTKSTHKYKSNISGYRDEYGSDEPLELDDSFFEKYGISKKAKVIVATAEKPNLFVADGSQMKEGQSNYENTHGSYQEDSAAPYEDDSSSKYQENPDTPYQGNPGTPYQGNPDSPYQGNPGTPYQNNPGTPYQENSGAPYEHSREIKYGLNGDNGGPTEEYPASYQENVGESPLAQIPGSFDSLVHTNPAFLRNLGSTSSSRPGEYEGGHGSPFAPFSMRNTFEITEPIVISKSHNGKSELVQKHADGMSRIIFNKGNNPDFDESKHVENIQAHSSQPKMKIVLPVKSDVTAKVSDETKKNV